MRTWGRDANGKWIEVVTDPNGYDDAVWITTLAQNLKLQPNESPFFADHGILAQQSVIQQVFPGFYVARTQQQFSPYFASLNVAQLDDPTPTYNVNVLTNQGSSLIF